MGPQVQIVMKKELIKKRLLAIVGISIAIWMGSLQAESGCPTGFIPSGEEHILNPEFTSFDGFTTDVPSQVTGYPFDGNPTAYPNTGVGIMAGTFTQGEKRLQTTFPGDSVLEGGADPVPAVNTWLAYNGNDPGAPTKIWEQTVSGLVPNQIYVFSAYFSNVAAPGYQAVGIKASLLRFEADGNQVGDDIEVCDSGSGIDVADADCQVEATEDLWHRFGVTVNPGSRTSITLSLQDAQIKTAYGNDLAMTQFSFKECSPIGFSVSPESVNFGSVELGDSATQTVTITNEGADDLTLGTIPAPSNTAYVIATDNCSGQVLAASDSCTVALSFTPASQGASNGALDVPYGDPVSGTKSITLNGSGVAGLDSDGDGVPDAIDIDDDNDGIKDVDEGTGDFDGDGIVNRLDLDSDNDGLSDIIEALGVDSDTNGRVDDFVDVNGDGFHDPLDQTPWALPDTDGDGNKDFLDVDSDGDGITDTTEAGLTDVNGDGAIDNFNDPDGDGWDNNATAVLSAGGLVDSDGDGTPDYRQSAGKILTRIDGGVGAFGLSWLTGLMLLLLARRRRALPGMLLVLVSFGAQAEKGQVYLGAGAGISTLKPEIVDIPDLSVIDKDDTGFKLFLGYDITNRLSIEGVASKMGAAGFSNGGSIDYNTYGASLVATLPQNKPGLALLGKLGLAVIDNSASGLDAYTVEEVENKEIFAGVGAEYQFGNQFSVRGEYEYFDKDAQLISLNLLKRFGGAPVPPPAATPTPVAAPAPVPVAPKPAAEVQKLRLSIESIHFDTDSSELKPESVTRLKKIAALMKAYPDIDLLLISGHTDSRASDEYNMVLGFRRAKAAYDFLINAGVKPARLAYESRGEREPVADNNTKEGRALNRRVEFDPTPDEVIKK